MLTSPLLQSIVSFSFGQSVYKQIKIWVTKNLFNIWVVLSDSRFKNFFNIGSRPAYLIDEDGDFGKETKIAVQNF